MKSIKPALAAWLLALSICDLSAQLTPVQYNASDFTGTSNNLPATLTSLQKVRMSRQTMLIGLPICFTPVNGTYTTNLFPGLYDLTIQGVDVGVTCLVPASTNLQTLAACVINELGLFSATNLNATIINSPNVIGGTNIVVTSSGLTLVINGAVTNLSAITNLNVPAVSTPNLYATNGYFSGISAVNNSGNSDFSVAQNSANAQPTVNIGLGASVAAFAFNVQETMLVNSNLTITGVVTATNVSNNLSGSFTSYGNGQTSSGSVTTTGVPNCNVYFGSTDNGGFYQPMGARFAFVAIGGGLSGSQFTIMSNLVYTLQSALNRQ